MKLLLILSTALFALVVGCGSDGGASSPVATRPSSTATPNFIPVLERPDGPVLTPDFTLPSASGEIVRLSDYRGKQPVAVVFYRGFF